jgi:hypothetical protein
MIDSLKTVDIEQEQASLRARRQQRSLAVEVDQKVQCQAGEDRNGRKPSV